VSTEEMQSEKTGARAAATDRAPVWSVFDEAWYLRTYPEVPEWMEREHIPSAQDFYTEIGQRYGHSPNPFFDENWYRQVYPDIYRSIARNEVQSGFAHYRAEGCHDRDPHWLFSESAYRWAHPALTDARLAEQGFANGYDHFLAVGALGFSKPHAFFDASLCEDIAFRHDAAFNGRSLFSGYLSADAAVADSGRVSWYFDPVWYLQTYPDVAQEIAEGVYRSALHHYLTNDTPRLFDPQPFFSEAHYAEQNPDVMPSITEGHFRNGYEHFVGFGAREGRTPAPGVDLRSYAAQPRVQADIEDGLYPDAYAHCVARQVGGAGFGLSGTQYPVDTAPPDEAATRAMFVREAEALLPGLIRRPPAFHTSGVPEISVIVVAHDQLALTMMALASLRANYGGNIELLLVNSGSHDDSRHFETLVPGARVLNYRYNLGYLEGCNAALKLARAPAVLLLNNDLRLYPGAIAHMLRRLHADPTIGAVGSKLIRTNMRLQEAGSIIWRDGATYGYRREDDPGVTEANFVRDVDYSSAACLLVRADLMRALGGYDPTYRPAYFEDADLCLRLTKRGARIVYEPLAVVEHLEFGSSGSVGSQTLIRTNHRVFARQHADFLRHQQPAHVRNAVLARGRRGAGRRILYIEDRLPLRALGSGYVRSNDVVREMAALGHQVTVFPVLPRRVDVVTLYRDFPETVELIADRSLADFAEFLQDRAGYYDLVWIGRVHNMARLLPIMNEMSRYLPPGGAVLDTEVVATPRTLRRAEVLGLPMPAESMDELLRLELESAHFCQRIVAVTEADAALIRRAGYDNVSTLGHLAHVMPTPRPFAERSDILFIGALHDEGSPNHDALLWFVQDVLPLLDGMLAPGVKVRIAGFLHPSVDPGPLGLHARVELLGPVDELEPLYDAHRVFIAPTRFAGGLPFKLHEAAAYGLPAVATDLLIGQLGWQPDREIVSGGNGDPLAFAQAVARLHDDPALWETIREGAIFAVSQDCAPERFRETLSEILESCMV
jgi:O-antigen biosynthesis protein